MKNNLIKASEAGHPNAAKACYYIKRLRELTGRTEQSLLAQLVSEGVEGNPKFEEFREDLVASWKETCTAPVQAKR